MAAGDSDSSLFPGFDQRVVGVMAQDQVALMRSLGFQRFDVLGHSAPRTAHRTRAR